MLALYFAALFGIVLCCPSFFGTMGPKITLGLDLQGGLSMLLGVKVEEAVQSKMRSLTSSISFYAQQNQILIDDLTSDETSVRFELLDTDDQEKIDSLIAKNGNFIIDSNNG
ncbi:MAG: protein translocase subunit SecD, partial [Helicobacter sp.]|nr:protein translocase subunit SecD [Helicobacter sp.]